MAGFSLRGAFNEKLILTDVDGVLLDLHDALKRFMAEEKGISLTEEQWKSTYYIHKILGISREEEQEIIVDFYHSDYFRNIPALPHAVETVQALRDEGWRFIVVTAAIQELARQDIELTRQNRIHNLETVFGKNTFDEYFITEVHGCKSGVLKQFNQAVWVEDSVKNALIGDDCGHVSFVMNSDYYKEGDNHKSLPVANDWRDIRRALKFFG